MVTKRLNHIQEPNVLDDTHEIIKISILNRPFVLREMKPRTRENFSPLKSTRWINEIYEENKYIFIK